MFPNQKTSNQHLESCESSLHFPMTENTRTSAAGHACTLLPLIRMNTQRNWPDVGSWLVLGQNALPERLGEWVTAARIRSHKPRGGMRCSRLHCIHRGVVALIRQYLCTVWYICYKMFRKFDSFSQNYLSPCLSWFKLLIIMLEVNLVSYLNLNKLIKISIKLSKNILIMFG